MNCLFSRCFGLIFTLTLILTSSCKDEDSGPSKRPLLVDKVWTLVKYEIDGVPGEPEECESDDTTTFFADGTYLEDVGTLICDEFDTNIEGTWEFKANETIISMAAAGDSPSDWNIVELSENTLKISQYVSILQANVVVEMQVQ